MTGYFGNIFSGVGQQMPGQGGNHFNPGFMGLVVVDAIKIQQSHKGGHNNVIVEVRILESNMPDKPVGGAGSWVLNTTHQPWKGNFTGFLAAASGISPNNEAQVKAQINEQVAEFAVGAQQPFRGRVLRLQTSQILTQGKRQPFTKHDWTPVDQAQYATQVQQLLSSATVATPGQQQPPAAFNVPGVSQPQPAAAPPAFPGAAQAAPPAYAPQPQQPFASPQAAFQPPAMSVPPSFPGASTPPAYSPPAQSAPLPFVPQAAPGGAAAFGVSFGAPPVAAPPPVQAQPAGPTDWIPNVNDTTGTWEWSPSTGKQRNKATGQII